MLKLKSLLFIFLILFLFNSVSFAAGYGYGAPNDDNIKISLLPTQSLDDNETNALIKMRQEEKLARDVYLTLYEKWKLQIFYDIAQSEQNHTDMVKNLIEKYQLTDPVTDDAVGVFSQEEFTNLYNQLVEEGSKSVIDALKVGATIEDLDINDLNHELSLTDNEDIKQVFENLKQGSYNHMRGFVSALEAYGATYTPQYISQEEFDEILSSGTGMNYGKTNSTYTQLPGKMLKVSLEERQKFSFQPKMDVTGDYDNQTAQLFAIVYSEDAHQYYILTAPNKFTVWNPGDEIVPFDTVTITENSISFPIITEELNLSNLKGTFDFFYGYKIDDGKIIFTSDKLIFE